MARAYANNSHEYADGRLRSTPTYEAVRTPVLPTATVVLSGGS
jgi:hypothetical protein